MTRPRWRKKLARSLLGAAALAAFGSCGGAPPLAEATLGEPAFPADADREIRIEATINLRFIPSYIEVSRGETVTFVVRNSSRIQHEFMIGDEELQEQHEELLRSSHVNRDAPYVIDLPPGATRELTWEFTRAGDVPFSCHIGIPSHSYEGMVGTIEVIG